MKYQKEYFREYYARFFKLTYVIVLSWRNYEEAKHIFQQFEEMEC